MAEQNSDRFLILKTYTLLLINFWMGLAWVICMENFATDDM